jgi:hypothetical protein
MAHSTAFARFDAGAVNDQHFVTSLNLIRAGIDEVRAELLCRFIEFWCQKNCHGLWRIELADYYMTVSFEDERDAVLFKISNEYGYYEDRWKAILNDKPLVSWMF